MKSPSGVSKWPRAKKFFGIAHSWPGAAWVALQLDQSGLLPMNPRTIAAIGNRLRHRTEVTFQKRICISHFIGSGAYPIIAANAAVREKIPITLLRETVASWMHDCKQSCHTDVMMGAAGALLACVELDQLMPGQIPHKFVKRLHQQTTEALRKSLVAFHEQNPVYLGLSHGLAGYSLALEMSNAAFGFQFNHTVRTECFDAITESRFSIGNNAMVWPKFSGEDWISYHSWCHGAPGIGLALLCAYKVTGFDAYRQIAEQALQATFQRESGPSNFCCGRTGCAQILIEAYRLTNNPGWLKKARSVAARVETFASHWKNKRGFHGGKLGYDYLLWRLKHPAPLCLPGLGIFSQPY
jgi:lantibiotic modifying enzyme